MQLSFNNMSRSMWLVVCLALIGGSACFAPPALTPEQQLARQQIYAEQNRLEIEKLQQSIAAGNPQALMQLGSMTVMGERPGVTRDIPKGMAMLEKAAATPYGPAEHMLGWLLIDGRTYAYGLQLNASLLPRDPLRGIELLKRSASRSCTPGNSPGEVAPNSQTAHEISNLYRAGSLIAQDDAQAELWFARSLIHCQSPNAYLLAGYAKNPKTITPQLQIDTLAKLMLLPSSDPQAALQSTMSDENVEAARAKAQQLRDAVRESEKQFPAPNPIVKK